jgi:hypothetical protein
MNRFQEMHLDYVNNFLTVDVFAEYYSLTLDQANYVIKSGKQYHEASLVEVA